MIDLKPLPMEEAQAFWRGKVRLGPGEFARLSAEAKVRAFAVSGMAKGAELDTVFSALQRAIDAGTSFADFKADLAEILGRRGWTGPRAWRVDNIFRTNIQTAYGVGRYRQMQQAVAERPFWQYSAVNDSRTRPTHAAMDGKVFRHDDPFWDTWYPPNGFRCRCGVVTLSEEELHEQGLSVEERDPTGRLVEPMDPLSGRKLPARLMMPDPGFAHHPGKVVWGGVTEALAEHLEQWPVALGKAVLSEQLSGPAFAAWYQAPQGTFPVGRLSRQAAEAMGAKRQTVQLSAATATKQAARHPELTAAEYARVQAAIDHGRQIQDGARSLIYVLEEEQGYVSVVKSTGTGQAVYLTSFRRLSADQVKRDAEVRRLLKRRGKQ
jgi:SPP1 gp7 family putative phage head morphogenesis protein